MTASKSLPIPLLLLRLSIALVMAVWALDKIINPAHAGAVFSNFYGLKVDATVLAIIGAVQLVIVAAFVAGLFKTLTYGAVLAMHAASTFSSWRQYLDPFDHLLFFAAWPMLAACAALFLLRKNDTLLSFHR